MKIETPLLERMGPVPFWRGEERCLESLETAYRRASLRAEEALSRERPSTESRTRPTKILSTKKSSR